MSEDLFFCPKCKVKMTPYNFNDVAEEDYFECKVCEREYAYCRICEKMRWLGDGIDMWDEECPCK